MRQTTKDRLIAILTPTTEQKVWEWAAEHVEFNLNPAYPNETGLSRYDAEYTPFWKEPAEALTDPSVAEIAVLKCSQAGGTEALVLNAVRYFAAVAPRRMLYVSGDQAAAESDFRERIVGGIKCVRVLHKKLAASRHVECRLELPDCVVAAAWPKNRQAFKRNPWSVIFADEFSTYPDLTPGMIRKRCDTVPFSKIVWLSSPDPQQKRASTDDPIFQEWLAGDMRYWFMDDPGSGKPFRFEMGGRELGFGLRWDKEARNDDGTWDMEQVRSSAHYVTPDGTRIDNKGRMALVRAGRWVATNPHGTPGKRSYHISAFYMPFKSGDFGQIACAFLEAKHQGTRALKVFLYEYLAEPWDEDTESVEDSVVVARQRDYQKGGRMSEADRYRDIYVSKPCALFLTADLQKGHHWYVVREWIDGGDSGLVEWGYGVLLEDLRKKDEACKASKVFADNGYKARSGELLEACMAWQWMPCIGSPNLAIPWRRGMIDPLEGRVGGGSGKTASKTSLAQITFDTDVFKTLLLDMMRGEAPQAWGVYQGVEPQYTRQVSSEQRVDGAWVTRRGHPQNHLWDCEVLQLLCATVEGFYRNDFLRG